MKHPVQLTINGHPFEAEKGQKLVDVIRQAGSSVPSLCYYPHIDPPLGTCRVCTVLVDGKPTAACTYLIREPVEVVTDTAELADVRKGMVELLFAEGNHFCPACEKSGDCDLQGLGYQLGVKISRFPHFFIHRLIDYRPERLVIEHNRCIRCRRCVEEVLTKEGKRVFSFTKRGDATSVAIDYEQERQLSEAEAIRATQICPVGAILVRGKSLARPRGERKYDQPPERRKEPTEVVLPPKPDQKKKIATTSLAGCFGCHMSLLDIDDELLDLIEWVEIGRSPLTDIKKFDGRYDLGLIEGGCCNNENIEVLKAFREHCDVLVAVGECAIWGGLPAMRNFIPIEECLLEAYGRTTELEDGQVVIPHHEELPELLDRVYGCNELVRIDQYIPGCPPDASHIWKVLKNVLFGADYAVTHEEFKYD